MSSSASSASPEISEPAPRKGRGRRPLIIALVVVLVLVLIAAASVFFVAPRLCGLTEPARHGLACDIPLPAGAQFAGQPNPGAQISGVTAEAWSFTVSGTGAQVDTVTDLYKNISPARGGSAFRRSSCLTPQRTVRRWWRRSTGIARSPSHSRSTSPIMCCACSSWSGVSPTPLRATVDIGQAHHCDGRRSMAR